MADLLHCILTLFIGFSSLCVSFPAPEPGPAAALDVSAEETDRPPYPSPSSGPSPGPALAFHAEPPNEFSPAVAPSLVPSPMESPSQSSTDDQAEPYSSSVTSTNNSKIVKWCAVREEFADCQYALSLLRPLEDYTWSCTRKQSAFDCMLAINNQEADLMTLDAGLAYIAFMNYSMKAILAEEYCYHSKFYQAVAVVNKEMCEKNLKLSLKDFQGLKSCHPGYRTASGWNYPIHFLIGTDFEKPLAAGDEAIISSFFSATCAPSELEGRGICSSCGNNGSCPIGSIYAGFSGAFRCLMDGTGDIAFLRSDTVQGLSADGSNKQDWSTKSVNEFMYLCPQEGCRPINDNLANCTFGSVPANLIMTRNSQPNSKRLTIVQTLLNASWSDALYSGKNWQDHVLSASAQNLVEVKELTREYLGDSAVLAQHVQDLNSEKLQTTSTMFSFSGSYFSATVSVLLLSTGVCISLQRHW
eukprot:c9142_g1_i1 orf=474-1886(-)